jgi:serine/threonine protein kinase
MLGLRAHVGGLRGPGQSPPQPVITGNTRSYELVGSVPGRAGITLARQHGELGFSKLVAIRTIPSVHAEIVRALVIDEARLRHANIVSTLDVLVTGDALHVVMEYVEGPCLADIIAASVGAGRRLPVAVAVAIVHDILLGLEHAHGAHDESIGLSSMVHCDVAPRNVIVGRDGLARILDLGIARTSGAADDTGKIGYLAPEQVAEGLLDRTVDIYTCGVILWELLTGARLTPSQAGAPPPKASARVRGITAELDAIVLRALSVDPRERYITAAGMAKALSHAMELATRAEIADALSQLLARTPNSGVRLIEDADAFQPFLRSGRRLRLPSFASLRVRASDVARFFPASLRPSAWLPHLTFATRMLLVFSAVLVLALAVVSGRSRVAKRHPAPAATIPPASSVPFGPPVASDEAPVMEVDEMPSASPAASTSTKAGRHKAGDGKSGAKAKPR